MGGLRTNIRQLISLAIFICLSGCQNDDNTINDQHVDHKHIRIQKVSLHDFPEIANYVNRLTTKDNPLRVQPSSNPYANQSRDVDLVLLDVDLDNVIQSLDENEKSNFAISASAETSGTPTEFRFVTYNLVISEYGEEAYSFIVEYEYDRNWIASQPIGNFDYSTLSGFIRFYDIYGQFVQEHTYVNGQVLALRGSDPCNDDDTDPDPDPTGGGDGPTVVITCGCDPSHNGGNSNPVCSCTLPDIITIYNFGPEGGDTDKDPLRSPDPCSDGTGGGDGGDGDGDGGNTNLPDECFLPNGDPIDCENPNIPLTPQELQENYFSLLTALGDLVPDFWTDYIPEMLWLGDNKDIASEMLYYLVDENYSESSVHFVMEALTSTMEGGQVNFDEKLIMDPTISECVQNIIDPLITKSDYVSLVPNLPVNINLSSLILDIFNNSSNHNYKIKVGNLPSGFNALTTAGSQGGTSFLYTTTINSSYISNATDLAIARTIIHESAHAYLSYIYQEQPLSSISVALRHHLSQNGYDTNAAQHEFMVQYVDAIAYSLQNWDNNSLLGIEYYRYLAWSGDMLNTTDFNQLPAAFRNNVIDANIAEGQAGSGNGSTSAARGINNCQN
ncbi:MAG: hypothetical protein Aureis2KO_18060 [Aureisphaera sp.]